MRARLQDLDDGGAFKFVCDSKLADKMERVVKMAGGEIATMESHADGTVIEVIKSETR